MALRRVTCSWWHRRSSPRRRAVTSISPASRLRHARTCWRAEVGKDPRLVEVILSESLRVVRAARRADRRASARLRHGQCRRRPVERGAAGRRRARAAAAAGPGASAETLRGQARRHGAADHPTASAARGGAARSAWRSARPACRRCSTCAASRICSAAPCRSPIIGLRRRDRRGGVAGDGPGRRGAAGGAGARPQLEGAGDQRRRAGAPGDRGPRSDSWGRATPVARHDAPLEWRAPSARPASAASLAQRSSSGRIASDFAEFEADDHAHDAGVAVVLQHVLVLGAPDGDRHVAVGGGRHLAELGQEVAHVGILRPRAMRHPAVAVADGAARAVAGRRRRPGSAGAASAPAWARSSSDRS